jgi:Ni,Fe-hydrogenase I large subunit
MVTKTITFSPFTRLEGDLLIEVDVEDGYIVRSRASGTLFRGFETMLRGRDPLDAIVITCRVCGQCGLTHSAASAQAIRALTGSQLPRNAYFASNIMLAIEAIVSHLTHFYLSFMPDLAEAPYMDNAAQRFLPMAGGSLTRALREREEILGVLGLFAGKWPNSLAIQPGGTTRPVNASEIRRAQGLLNEYRKFIEVQLLGCELDEWLALRSATELDRWLGEGSHLMSDLGIFLTLALEHGLDKMGIWPARFLSSGGWPGPTGEPLTKAGFSSNGERRALDPDRITEHVKHSWYADQEGGLNPCEGRTDPDPQRQQAYSWAKAPRYAGHPAEAGPLARLANGGDPLLMDLLARHGPSVLVREMARLHEAVRLIREIGTWLNEVDPAEPFYQETPRPGSGSGFGLVEAPRGILGHWLRVEQGKIQNYQIITPTGWNLSPRDSFDHPGPLEEALVGAPVPDPDRPAAVSHVVKSFDPCLFCTVH